MSKRIALLIAATAFYIWGLCLLPQIVPAAGAANLSQAYQNLKNNYPGTIQQMKDADPSLTDSDIEALINDVSSELQSKGTLTEANIDSKFYEAALSVMLKPQHGKVVGAALKAFSITMNDILNKRLPAGFESIKSSIKMELLNGSQTPGTPSGGGATPATVAPQSTTPPGAAATVTQETLAASLKKAAETGIIKIEAAQSANQIALSKDQLAKIKNDSKPMTVEIQGVQMKMPAGALESSTVEQSSTVQVELGVRKISEGEKPAGTIAIKVVGDVYEITVVAVQQDGKKTGIKEFKAGITLSLPVPATFAGNPADLKVSCYDENTGGWNLLGGSYDAASGRIVYDTNHFSKYTLTEVKQEKPAAAFSDIKGHWAEKDILAMAARGIVKGTGGRALPDDKVTRAQFATFLALLLGISETGADLPFTDADRTAWYYGSLSRAYRAGLISGYGDGKIGPDDLITREQMAVMAVGAARHAGRALPAAGALTFSDKGDMAPWSSGPVAVARSLGIINGYPDNTFRPRDNATRAEALVMLNLLRL